MDSLVSTVTVRIKRYDPSNGVEPHWCEYVVPRSRALRVLDVLEYIQEELDPTLGYRPHMCRDLVCGGCWVQVNGHKRMSCGTPLAGMDTIMLEPIKTHAVIRDLAVDYSHPLQDKSQG